MTRRILDSQVFVERRDELDRQAGTDPARWFAVALAASANGGSMFNANLARRRLAKLGWCVAFNGRLGSSDRDPRELFRGLVDARQRRDGEAIRCLLADLRDVGVDVLLTDGRQDR